MHIIVIDTAAVTGPVWTEVLAATRLPALSRRLRLAEPVAREPERGDAEAAWLSPAERWFQHALGLEGERAPWGALAVLGRGADPGATPWGWAMPVHLALGRESLSLADPAGLALRPDEAAALLEAARPLLDDEGWRVDASDPARWLIGHASLGEVLSADPARAIGRNVASWMPAGTPARPWRRLLTEIQMVWQHHPVNEERIAAGLPEVNTLWLHGCGTLPPELRSPFQVEADAGSPDWFAAAAPGLARLPATRHPHRLRLLRPAATRECGGDELAVAAQGLDMVAAEVIDEALAAHEAARVVLAGELGWVELELRRSRRWQFWRRADADVLLGMV